MTKQEKLETKDLIVKIASDLFSRFGYDGTSVRDIASQCDINIASVNYHFGSKHNLYWATVDAKQTWLDQGMKDIAGGCDNVVDLLEQAYDFLMKDPAAVRTTLKMLLTDGVPEPEGELRAKMMSTTGPPGSVYIMEVLKSQCSENVSEEALSWAVKSLFSALIHWAMMSSSCKVEMMKAKHPELCGDGIEKILRHQAQAIVDYLNKNPELTSV